MVDSVLNDLDFNMKDEYYLFYEMMIQCLNTDNVLEGINKSLYLLRLCLKSGSVVLYEKNDNGVYTHKVCDVSSNNNDIQTSSYFVNKTSSLIEKKGIFNLDLNLSEEFKNMLCVHFNTQQKNYILSLNNFCTNLDLDHDFWQKLQDTFRIIMKRAESYQRNIHAISYDLLTGLENRNAYEIKIQNLDEKKEFVYGIFDLFRLKYINDNYSHALGDLYIKEAAKILNKYWPKSTSSTNNDSKKLIETGHNLYRIGGDEFVLMTTEDGLDFSSIKARLAAEEVSMIDLGIEEKPIIGLNIGIVTHNPNDSIKQTYQEADYLMNEDKTLMYRKYGLERRR